MKKIIILSSLIAALGFTGCDVERLPYDSYTDEKINESGEAAVDILLNGCYGRLKSWSEWMHYTGEFGADNMMKQATSSGASFRFISYQHTTTNYGVGYFWNYAYKVIAQSSSIVDLIEEGKSKELDQQLGEAYYLRGMLYFYLCRAFGRPYYQSPETNLGVPIINGTPEDMDNLQLPDRATVKETYEQAINDLKKAEQLMNIQKTAAYATKGAAQAMLARIYIYMSGTYDNPNVQYADSAIHYCDAVINSGNYALLSHENFKKYNEYSPEDKSQTETIFAIKMVDSEFTADDYDDGLGGMYAVIDGLGYGQIFASAKYLDLLRKTKYKEDARWSFIKPQYLTDDAGNKTDVFRFVAPMWNFGTDGSKKQAGYKYIQAELLKNSDGSLIKPYQVTISEQIGAKDLGGGKNEPIVDKKTYTLKTVDEKDNSYTIDFYGTTYTGEKDYRMIEDNGYPLYYIYKCSMQEGHSHLHSPIISRLAELYLTKAEAYAKKGNYQEALVNLNTIRERAIIGGGYTELNADNAAQRISEERQLEMAYEADRAYEVFRQGWTMERRYPGVHDAMTDIPATHPRVVQYIPQNDINAYPGTLTQNP